MGDRVHLDPTLAPALSAAGLARVDALLALGGDALPRSVVAPIELPIEGTSGRFHLKRYVYDDARARRRMLGRGTGWGAAPEEREFKVLARMRAAGVPAVRPVVAAARTKRGRLLAHVLLTEHVRDAPDLARRLADPGDRVARDARLRRRVLARIAEHAAALHAAELVHADLHARNVLVHLPADDEPEITFLDCRRGGSISGTRGPTLDLATLDGDLEGIVPATDRLRALRAYLPAGAAVRAIARAIARRRRRLRRSAARRLRRHEGRPRQRLGRS